MPAFGGLKGNVHGLSMARWKARGRLPIVLIELFSPAFTQILVEIVLFERSGSLSAQISRGRGHPPTNLVSEN